MSLVDLVRLVFVPASRHGVMHSRAARDVSHQNIYYDIRVTVSCHVILIINFSERFAAINNCVLQKAPSRLRHDRIVLHHQPYSHSFHQLIRVSQIQKNKRLPSDQFIK